MKLYGQDCSTVWNKDWKIVEVKIIETMNDKPEGYTITGEAVLKVKNSISTEDNLTKNELKKIKKKAAKYGSCFVYIDLKCLYSSFSGVKKGGKNFLYYYFENQLFLDNLLTYTIHKNY